MLSRMLGIFLGSAILLGLTSCGQKSVPETTMAPQPQAPQAKPLPPADVPPPTPVPAPTKGHKIGLLLPLSGPHADLGKGMLDAAEMALFETQSTSVTLLPQDTAKGAHQAALKALGEGAELLLGPVFASEVEAVRPLLSARNVSLIAFSTDQSVAGNGSYIIGFLPSQQLERALTFSKEKGVTLFAALTPDNQYGQLIDKTLKHLDALGKIQLLGITHYTKADLLEGNPGNARILEEVSAYKTKGVEALVIPEGGENLAHLATLLNAQLPLKIIGSGQWDSSDTLRLSSFLKEGIFASTDPQERQNFDTRFQSAYGYKPPRIATLSYDAVALAVALADKGYTPQNLTFSQGFSGIEGLFRLNSQGLNERGLSVLEVTPSGFRTLSPSAASF
jgi:branched-chain amino acid transport system substrate-binding protein